MDRGGRFSSEVAFRGASTDRKLADFTTAPRYGRMSTDFLAFRGKVEISLAVVSCKHRGVAGVWGRGPGEGA